MCRECDWIEDKGAGHQIRKPCDCGNFRWQRTALVAEEATEKTLAKPLYRCTKCDSLRLAEHLLHHT